MKIIIPKQVIETEDVYVFENIRTFFGKFYVKATYIDEVRKSCECIDDNGEPHCKACLNEGDK